MKLVDNILYIEWNELLDSGVPLGTLKTARSRNSKSWRFISDPEDKRKVLCEYEFLGERYKNLLSNKFGNPYDYVAKQPIRDMVQWDSAAEEHFLSYRYDGDKVLSRSHVDKYTAAANWLNMLNEACEDKKQIKKLLGLTIDQFYLHVTELIKLESVSLPTSYRKLKQKQKDYAEKGYDILISSHFGHKRSAKISDSKSESVLLKLLSHPNQYDDVFICNQYNEWAKSEGYKTITSKTVWTHRHKNAELLTFEREGISAFKDKFSMKIRGSRPTAPLYLVENDDNHVDLFFTDGNNHHIRYKAIVVMDSFNNYVLGYAYAQNLTKDLVRAAYVNAMHHIKEITGGWYLPHETKSDKWAIKDLKPFYESMGHYVDARLGNKHRGYIEQFFGSNHWKNCLKLGANNYSGNNITASNRGVNTEFLSNNQKVRPFLGSESVEQMERFFHNLRHYPLSNGMSKQEEWLNAWYKLADEDKKLISDELYLSKFGIEHNYRGEGVSITSKGVDVQINGEAFSYQLPVYKPEFIGKRVSVVYDPYDMSKVLLTDHETVREIACEAQFMPRALKDHTEGTMKYLKASQNAQNEHANKVAQRSMKIDEELSNYSIDAEAILQANVLDKSQRQIAEVQINQIEEKPNDQEINPFEGM